MTGRFSEKHPDAPWSIAPVAAGNKGGSVPPEAARLNLGGPATLRCAGARGSSSGTMS